MGLGEQRARFLASTFFCAVRHTMAAAAAIVRAAFASGAAPPPGRLRACSRCHGEGGLYTRGKRRSGGAAAVIRRPCANCGGIGLVDGMLPPPRHEPGPRDRAFVGTVAIAGGGIGGAAAALALQQRGFRVVVYERDSNFDQRAQGYGLTMQQGATALAQLGLPNEGVFSYAHSSFLPDGTLLGEYGRGVHESTRERMGNGRGKAQRRNAHIPRQALRAALLDPLLPGTVRWGKAIARFDAGDSGVILHFEDGSPPERAAPLRPGRADRRRHSALRLPSSFPPLSPPFPSPFGLKKVRFPVRGNATFKSPPRGKSWAFFPRTFRVLSDCGP